MRGKVPVSLVSNPRDRTPGALIQTVGFEDWHLVPEDRMGCQSGEERQEGEPVQRTKVRPVHQGLLEALQEAEEVQVPEGGVQPAPAAGGAAGSLQDPPAGTVGRPAIPPKTVLLGLMMRTLLDLSYLDTESSRL